MFKSRETCLICAWSGGVTEHGDRHRSPRQLADSHQRYKWRRSDDDPACNSGFMVQTWSQIKWKEFWRHGISSWESLKFLWIPEFSLWHHDKMAFHNLSPTRYARSLRHHDFFSLCFVTQMHRAQKGPHLKSGRLSRINEGLFVVWIYGSCGSCKKKKRKLRTSEGWRSWCGP